MKRPVFYIVLPTLFYLVYFLVANSIDTLFGDQQLINWLTFDSRSILLKTFFNDWWQSLPVMYAIMFLLVMPAELLVGRLSLAAVLIYLVPPVVIGVLSYVIGFKELGLIINIISVLAMVVFYRLAKMLVFKG